MSYTARECVRSREKVCVFKARRKSTEVKAGEEVASHSAANIVKGIKAISSG